MQSVLALSISCMSLHSEKWIPDTAGSSGKRQSIVREREPTKRSLELELVIPCLRAPAAKRGGACTGHYSVLIEHEQGVARGSAAEDGASWEASKAHKLTRADILSYENLQAARSRETVSLLLCLLACQIDHCS
jgi:hypothetical protein